MGKLNLNAMKEKLDNVNSNSNRSNADYDKLQDGKNVRRILWPKGDSESFYSEGYLHFSLGEDGKKVVTCPKTFGSKNPCPICEYVDELKKSKDKDDKKMADAIKQSRRIYVNVLSRDGDDEEEVPKVLPIGVTILKGLLETICDADYGDITDPDDGRDVTITKKGKGMQTEYSVLPKPKSSKVSEELSVDEIEEAMTDLDTLFVKKSYEELEAILNGEELDDSDSEDEDDDEEESAGEYDEMTLEELEEMCDELGIKMPVKRTRLKLISLLENYSEDEDDEEEPAPKKSSKPKKESESDDEEDEDDDNIKDAIKEAISKRNKKK